jgi:YD repeat-containing protein
MADATGTTTYSYTARDQLEGVAQPNGERITYSYDGEGNRATMREPACGRFTYTAVRKCRRIGFYGREHCEVILSVSPGAAQGSWLRAFQGTSVGLRWPTFCYGRLELPELS